MPLLLGAALLTTGCSAYRTCRGFVVASGWALEWKRIPLGLPGPAGSECAAAGGGAVRCANGTNGGCRLGQPEEECATEPFRRPQMRGGKQGEPVLAQFHPVPACSPFAPRQEGDGVPHLAPVPAGPSPAGVVSPARGSPIASGTGDAPMPQAASPFVVPEPITPPPPTPESPPLPPSPHSPPPPPSPDSPQSFKPQSDDHRGSNSTQPGGVNPGEPKPTETSWIFGNRSGPVLESAQADQRGDRTRDRVPR